MTELNKTQNSRANSRPNTTPRFMRLQSRRRIPCAAEPQTNRAIATAISWQRIDRPSPRDKKGTLTEPPRVAPTSLDRRAMRARKPVGCTSPSKTFEHVSRQTNIFLRLENRHFEQYAAFYASSRAASQSLPPRLLHNLSQNASHRAHINPLFLCAIYAF